MPFLALDGTTISCAVDSADNAVEEYGDRGRSHDGTLQTRLRARKDSWALKTTWLASAAAATARGALTGDAPIAATGDLTGSMNVYVELRGEATRGISSTELLTRFEFTVHAI